MPINMIEYSKIVQEKLDQQIIQGATSGWMEANAGQVKYNGGNEVKIPTISTQGLADYDRDSGFVQGGVTLSYETYKMTQDRGRTFQLDAMDVDETNFAMNATSVMAEFQKSNVIPEVDSYRYSKISNIATTAGQVEAVNLTVDNALSKLREHIRAIEDVIGEQPLIITLPAGILALIEDSSKIGKSINPGDFKQGELNLKVKKLDEHVLRIAPSARLKTKYDILDGKTSGQEAGGLKAAADAKDINWIITPANVPVAINKTDKIRIFTPDQNQKADAWKLDYRKYHDLWIFKNRAKSIFVSTKA